MIRSILITCFLAFIALIGFFSGAGELQRMKEHKLPFSPILKDIAADRDFPVTDHKLFTIVLYAHNASDWCERALRSVFEQDYDRYRVVFVDDASSDGTLEKAQQFIVANHQDHRVIAIRNDTVLGPVGSLYRAADHCQDLEILIPLDAQNWLTFDGVLTRFNQAFQNPDIWIAFGQSIDYPSYWICDPPDLDRSVIEKKGFRCLTDFSCPSFGFYAGLFKAIHLPDLFVDGKFSQMPLSYVTPLLEESGGRYKSIYEPLVFSNHSIKTRDWMLTEEAVIQAREPYKPLAHFPLPAIAKGGVDVVVFSFDRPMQLFGALESIYHYVTNFQTISVLYRVSDQRFEDAYNLVKASFPKVRYIKQSENPRKDFKPLLLHAVFDSPSEFIVFGVDDMIMKDYVDLNLCKQMLEKTGAYGFYLRFGCHIQQSVPSSVPLMNGVLAWDLKKGEADWGYPNSMDMTVYRKSDLKKWFTELSYKNPNSLEAAWSEHHPANIIGLYFEQSRMVNLPLNVVNHSNSSHANFMTAEELLVKFNQGFKIDIDPLYQIENPSPHYDYIPEFVPR